MYNAGVEGGDDDVDYRQAVPTWSWMSFVFIVSTGVTTNVASIKPAIAPANHVPNADVLPFSSCGINACTQGHDS